MKPLRPASIIFMGPGSPTYAVRQLKNSLAWKVLRARYRLGSALIFASAATIAIGQWVCQSMKFTKPAKMFMCAKV
ncbi:MAG: hypothetical protein ACK8QZ_03990 [Anaerolineales bacterium]